MSGPTEKNWIANLVAVGIGCAVVVLALVAIQWFFGQSDMDRRHAKIKDDVSEAFYDSNSDEFGWKFIPNVKSHVVRKIGDQVVYDFHLTIDQYGRRVVQHEEKDGPPANGKAKDEFLLFFGGSFMVGEGLPDEQTLEYRLGEKLPQYKTYNYAVNGYGLGNVMAQADLIPFGEQIPQRKGKIIYLFPSFHVDRLVGGLQSVDWIGGVPYFKEQDGKIVRDWFLQKKFPIRNLLKKFFNKTFIRTKYQIDWPFHVTEKDLRWSCRLIAEIRDRVSAHFEQAEFLLVIYPWSYAMDVTFCLGDYGIQFLDLRDAFKGIPQDQLYIPIEGHPSGYANQILAEKIAEHLVAKPQGE